MTMHCESLVHGYFFSASSFLADQCDKIGNNVYTKMIIMQKKNRLKTKKGKTWQKQKNRTRKRPKTFVAVFVELEFE